MKISASATTKHRISIVDLDHLPLFQVETGLVVDAQTPEYQQVIQTAMKELSGVSLGVCCHPAYGLNEVGEKANKAGLLLKLVEQEETPNYETLPRLIKDWGVEHVANNYAVAQVELWYNPFEKEAANKKKLLAELADYCRSEGIELLLVLRMFLIEGLSPSFADLQLQAVKEFQPLVHAVALEYPESALSAATLTAELDIPWLLLSDVKDQYLDYKDKLRICLESGASGCYVDRLVWSGFIPSGEQQPESVNPLAPQLTTLENFIRTNSRDRLIELTRITSEYAVE